MCGGAVRNMLLCNNCISRDIDIIMGYVSKEQLETLFPNNIKGKTSLGGLKLQVKDWAIDMWPIHETWAFKEGKYDGKEFSDYPNITFLNIDAIAIQLFSGNMQEREIYSNGFFEAIAERIIELNYEENPTPAECIVKALHIAEKYKFVIGPKLAHYMVSYINQIGIEKLTEIYQRRYMSCDVTVDKLYKCFKLIKTQLNSSNNQTVKIFGEQSYNSIRQSFRESNVNYDLYKVNK